MYSGSTTASVDDKELSDFNEQAGKLPASFVRASTAGTAEKLSDKEPCHREGGCPMGNKVPKNGGWHCKDCMYDMGAKIPTYRERTIDEVYASVKKAIPADKKSIVDRDASY